MAPLANPREIRRIQRETGITTIFVTHDQEEAMSISDEIVVMNEGIKQQMDRPQAAYEEPVNTFVAKFWGTPINIFEADLIGGRLVLKDGEVVADGFTEPDQEVFIGFRPEYLRVSKNGKITAKTDLIEHIGRDTMILCEIEGYDHLIRAIVPNDDGA